MAEFLVKLRRLDPVRNGMVILYRRVKARSAESAMAMAQANWAARGRQIEVKPLVEATPEEIVLLQKSEAKGVPIYSPTRS